MVIDIKFENNTPKVVCLKDLQHFDRFLLLGQNKFCNFLKSFLNIEQVRIQVNSLAILKEWLNVKKLSAMMDVPESKDEICVVSQIFANNELIAYFPYVLKGRDVKSFLNIKNLIPKLAEAISDQITLCYLQDFKGGDWIFGENLARIIVSNCISSQKYDGIKFAHLIEKMEQLAATTFEGTFYPTGVIVSFDSSKYKESFFEFGEKRYIDNLNKREWFLANGQESFFILDSNANSRGIYRKTLPSSKDFIKKYYNEYFLSGDLNAPDFIVRAIGPNEISVSDSAGKEFVKIENTWRYRHCKRIAQLLVEQLQIEYSLSYAILYYTIKCSRHHVSSIIWVPNDCKDETISNFTTPNRVKIWNGKLSVLDESHQVLIERILASDGAIVIGKDGQILYESVFANMSKLADSGVKLVGSGETAARILAKNGVAIKVSQDGTIKIFFGDERIYY